MNKRTMFLIFFCALGLLFLTIYGLLFGEHRTKTLSETLEINLDDVTKIELSNLTGDYETTENKNDIKRLLNYLNGVEYKRLLNDQTTYMPKRATIIYIYVDDQSNFIVPYETEAMINYKVYKVKNGVIDQKVLLTYFHSLKEKDSTN